MTLELTLGSPGAPPHIIEILRAGLRNAGPNPRMRLGFAYATSMGVEALVSAMATTPAWHRARKEWILSVHHGLTEPAAVRTLSSVDNSTIHLHCGAPGGVTKKALFRAPFHAKIAAVATFSDDLVAVWAGSSNLTGAALSPQARNFEAGLAVVQQPRSAPLPTFGTSLSAWWETTRLSTVVANHANLNRYATLRDSLLKEHPEFYSHVDSIPSTHIEAATTLWIEAGAMSGGSRNQIEFSRDLAAFFGPVQTRARELAIKAGSDIFPNRPFAYKTTSFGVEIWRLSLPTETQCGFVYPGSVIRFRREAPPGTFSIETGTPGQHKATNWIRKAQSAGHTGVTSGAGHRVFGYY